MTSSKLLCCRYTSQCGSQGDERIVCVDTLVVLYLLLMLMIEDLAEHILISLASQINGYNESEMPGNEEDQQWMWNTSNWSEQEEISSH